MVSSFGNVSGCLNEFLEHYCLQKLEINQNLLEFVERLNNVFIVEFVGGFSRHNFVVISKFTVMLFNLLIFDGV